MKGLPPKPAAASSPGNVDKLFPPPLMRFLRSNVGRRSTRGRSSLSSSSRASPMFYLRSNRKTVNEISQEPSSPKVTCIGQVRVRRRCAGKCKEGRQSGRRCGWMRRPLICGKFCKGVDSIIRVCWKKKGGRKRGDVESGILTNTWQSNREIENLNKIEIVESDSVSISPPKNALILTRCRSAPYRSSSLGGKLLWGSPLPEEHQEDKNGDDKPNRQIGKKSEENPNSTFDLRIKHEIYENLKNSEGKAAQMPLILTRSKSEPARRGERLDPDAIADHMEHCSKHSFTAAVD